MRGINNNNNNNSNDMDYDTACFLKKLLQKFVAPRKPEALLSCSQNPDIRIYPEPNKLIPRPRASLILVVYS
jgi:hypothetical protein